MRQLFAYGLGPLLGPVLGALYYSFLILANLDRTPQRIAGKQAYLVRMARGLPPNAKGVTFGSVIYVKPLFPSSALIEHELTHVKQYERWGFYGFLVRIGVDYALHGYAHSHIEQEARDAVRTR